MSRATVKAHQRGLKNTLLWERRIPETAEDFHAYGVYLEDLHQEREAVIWYKKAAELGHVPASFQLAMLMKSGWLQGDFQWLFRLVINHDLHNCDVISYYRLGKCFTQGWGTQVDENDGWYWFNKAFNASEKSGEAHASLLYELSFYNGKGLARLEVNTDQARKYLEMAHMKGYQDAVWELWCQFSGKFSDFPFQRDYTEAWSFRLGRYLRAAETAPCKDYYLRLSRFYKQGFPEDSDENRLKMQRFAEEYADQAEHME